MAFSGLAESQSLLMRKTSGSRELDDKLILQLRRGMSRFGLRRYLYAFASLLLVFLMYRWLTREDTNKKTGYGYQGEIWSISLYKAHCGIKSYICNVLFA